VPAAAWQGPDLKISKNEFRNTPQRVLFQWFGKLQNECCTTVREGLEEIFTITEPGITGELARCLATTNVIESPNSLVRRVSRRVTNYKSADLALRWTAAGFLEAEKSTRKLAASHN
jgi:putative transposase